MDVALASTTTGASASKVIALRLRGDADAGVGANAMASGASSYDAANADGDGDADAEQASSMLLEDARGAHEAASSRKAGELDSGRSRAGPPLLPRLSRGAALAVARSACRSASFWRFAFGVASLLLLALLVLLCAPPSPSSLAPALLASVGVARVRDLPAYFHPWHERTLVLYVFSANDAVYVANLRFFVEAAVRANDPADYVFVIQQDADPAKRTPLASLPPLPPNARYVEHANECLDWGTYAWLLGLPADDPRAVPDQQRYSYFILMNSSVRGPFVPAWAEYVAPFDSPLFSWTQIFTAPLRRYGPHGLHYLGVSIQCSPTQAHIEHVQSYLVATDREGMAVLQRSSAWRCHSDFGRAVLDGEVGATQAMLHAGFNVGNIAAYSQLLDYRVQSHCTRHPDILTAGVDGVPLDPLDLVFTKFRTTLREYDSTFAFERVQRYDRWWRERQARKRHFEQTNGSFALE